MTTFHPAWAMGHKTNTPAYFLSYFLSGCLPSPGCRGRAWPLSPLPSLGAEPSSPVSPGNRPEMGWQGLGLGYFVQGQLSRGQPHIPPDPSSHGMTQQPTHPTPIQAQLHLSSHLGMEDSGTLENLIFPRATTPLRGPQSTYIEQLILSNIHKPGWV